MVAVIQCDAKVPAGMCGDLLRQRRLPHRVIRLFEGNPLPEPQTLSRAVVLGGFMGAGDTGPYPYLVELGDWLKRTAVAGLPLLGICLGGQLLASVLGGQIRKRQCAEHGVRPVMLTEEGAADPLFSGIRSPYVSLQWHNDSFTPPPGSSLLAYSPACPGQVFRYKNAYGVQFHPEVDAQTVTAWSELDPQAGSLESFLMGESMLQLTSRRLFENFLSLSPSL